MQREHRRQSNYHRSRGLASLASAPRALMCSPGVAFSARRPISTEHATRPPASPPSPGRAGRGTPASPKNCSSSSRAAVPIRLIMSPPRPTTIGFCDSRSTTIVQYSRRSAPGRAGRLLEPVDHHGARERDLGVRELQQLLAHDLRRRRTARADRSGSRPDRAARLPAAGR